jgi:hypothetical protein
MPRLCDRSGQAAGVRRSRLSRQHAMADSSGGQSQRQDRRQVPLAFMWQGSARPIADENLKKSIRGWHPVPQAALLARARAGLAAELDDSSEAVIEQGRWCRLSNKSSGVSAVRRPCDSLTWQYCLACAEVRESDHSERTKHDFLHAGNSRHWLLGDTLWTG